jgi:hypothetical protein
VHPRPFSLKHLQAVQPRPFSLEQVQQGFLYDNNANSVGNYFQSSCLCAWNFNNNLVCFTAIKGKMCGLEVSLCSIFNVVLKIQLPYALNKCCPTPSKCCYSPHWWTTIVIQHQTLGKVPWNSNYLDRFIVCYHWLIWRRSGNILNEFLCLIFCYYLCVIYENKSYLNYLQITYYGI